jgi:DNA repair exonuclease SbcCD ATPase subunit
MDFTGVTDSTPRSTIPAPSGPGVPDWASIIAAIEAQRPGGGGVSVNRGLFNLSETPEEAAMLAREMADIEARRSAGDIALREGWGNVQSANVAAAEKARAMAAQSGEGAAATWSQAAQQARDLAAQRAEAAGQFEGRAGIDVDPTGGAADFVGFMESQAPAERRFAERQQEILGSDLDWMAAMAGSQGEAYAGDLRRQSNVLSFERAREHNLRVQDRINQERMMLAQMEQQAQSTNAQLAAQRDQFDPFTQLNNMVGAAAVMGNPGILAQQLGVSVPQAQQMVDNFLQGTQATVQAATPVR